MGRKENASYEGASARKSIKLPELEGRISAAEKKFDEYLPLTGGRLTGSLKINYPAPGVTLQNSDITKNGCFKMFESGALQLYSTDSTDGAWDGTNTCQLVVYPADAQSDLTKRVLVGWDGTNYLLYGSHNQSLICDYIYPVGSVVCMSSNTNPSTVYGGTWALIDKEYKPQVVTATVTQTNTSAATVYAYLSGHQINFYISYTPSVALTDTSTVLFTITPSSCGATQFGNITRAFSAFGDVLNVAIAYQITTAGVVSVLDVMVRGSSTASVAPGSAMSNMNAITIYQNSISYMLDSFCNKFYFQRTA